MSKRLTVEEVVKEALTQALAVDWYYDKNDREAYVQRSTKRVMRFVLRDLKKWSLHS